MPRESRVASGTDLDSTGTLVLIEISPLLQGNLVVEPHPLLVNDQGEFLVEFADDPVSPEPPSNVEFLQVNAASFQFDLVLDLDPKLFGRLFPAVDDFR